MGYVNLTGIIAPLNPGVDAYPVQEDIFGKGGYMSVADQSERDAIPTLRRKWGMRVYTIGDKKQWLLEDGGSHDLADNTNWVDVTSTGVSSFAGLSDTPANYTNMKGQSLVVNSAENAVEFQARGANLGHASTSTVPVTDPVVGDFYVATADGDYSANFGPVCTIIKQNDRLIFDGTVWGPIAPWSRRMTKADALPEDIGGFKAGDTVDGMSDFELWEQLLWPYQYPAFTSFQIDGNSTIYLEVGETFASATHTVTWSTENPTNVQSNSIVLEDVTGGGTIFTGEPDDGTQDVTMGGHTYSVPSTYEYKLHGTNTKGDDFSRSMHLYWRYRVYWGNDPDPTVTETEIKAMANGLKTSFAGTYNFTNSGSAEYYYVVYPDAWGAISQWKDTDTGFSVAYDDAGTISVTNSFGETITYRVLRTTNQQTTDLNSEIS